MRKVTNWLKGYMEWTVDTESPDQYHFWTGVTVIGAVLRRQVYMEMNYFKIFPNFYTILVGPSGARKSVAANIGVRLTDAVSVRRFSEKITAAALIKTLSESRESRVEPAKGLVQLYSPMLIYASELGVFMGTDAYASGLIADLTDLYDCPPTWSKQTIIRETEAIEAPYISILAASTPQTLKDVIPMGAVGQGFTSRVIFVWAPGRRKRVPVPRWGLEHQMLETALTNDLKEIQKLQGVFTFTPDGLVTYQDYYMNHPEPEDEFQDERLRGYASRKDIHMLKLAMILSIAKGDSLKIGRTSMLGAIEAMNWLDQGLGSVFASHGSTARAEDVVRIYKQIDQATHRLGYVTHSELIRRNYNALNVAEFGVVIETLSQAGAIQEYFVRLPGSEKQVKVYKCLDENFLAKLKRLPGTMKES